MPFMIIWSLDLHPTPSLDSLWTFVYLLSSSFDTPSITELTTVATPVIAVPTIIIIWMNFFISISDHIKLNTRLLITHHDWLGLPSNSLIFTYTSQCKDTRFVVHVKIRHQVTFRRGYYALYIALAINCMKRSAPLVFTFTHQINAVLKAIIIPMNSSYSRMRIDYIFIHH